MEDLADEWLTVDAVAKLYGLSKHAVYRRVRSGAWDSFVSHFGRTIINREGLANWLRAGGDKPERRRRARLAIAHAPKVRWRTIE